jgi:glucosamine-6-phosphate deaminase
MLTRSVDFGELQVRIYDSRASMGFAAAKKVASWINEIAERRGAVSMVFAAAPSQEEMLLALVEMKDIPWSVVSAFHMDEYIGLKLDAPQGFGNFLRERIFSKLPFASVSYIDAQTAEPEKECKRYAELLAANPPDIVCMGIGENGHIAFNDPDVANFNDAKAVKVVTLDTACRRQQVNDGCFAQIGDVPTKAITLTIPTLISQEKISCVVPGILKAEAVQRTLNDPIQENCPATILRKVSGAILYLDSDSSSRIK